MVVTLPGTDSLWHSLALKAFQVTRTTKVSKFSCKLCGAVQSVRRIHGRSAQASDVRAIVSQLNALRHQSAPDVPVHGTHDEADVGAEAQEPPPVSRYGWAAFLEPEDRPAVPRELPADPGYVTALPERMPAAGSKRGRRAADEDEEENDEHRARQARPIASMRGGSGAAGGQPKRPGGGWGTFLVVE